MIGLYQNGIESTDVVNDVVIIGTQIRHHTDPPVSIGYDIGHGIRSVMGYRKGMDGKLADIEIFIRSYDMKQALIYFSQVL